MLNVVIDRRPEHQVGYVEDEQQDPSIRRHARRGVALPERTAKVAKVSSLPANVALVGVKESEWESKLELETESVDQCFGVSVGSCRSCCLSLFMVVSPLIEA